MAQSDIQAEPRGVDLESMEPASLVMEARANGLLVFAKDSKLIVRGPKNADTKLVNVLLLRKADLLPLLKHWDEGTWEYFEERVAIAQVDGGTSLLMAERLAWDDIQASQVVME